MQEIKSKKNNKMKIAIIVLSIALIVAIGGIFGVYAATQQNIKSSFAVRYSIGDNVAVALGAKTVLHGTNDDPLWFTTPTEYIMENENGLYVIPAAANDTYFEGLEIGDLSLPSINQWRWICFYIENLSDEYAITLTFTDGAITNPETQNMDVMYAACEVDNTVEMPTNKQVLDEEGYPDTSFNPHISLDENNQYSVTIQPGSIYAIEIGVGVYDGDINKAAAYVSDDNGGIAFKIEKA